MAVQDTLAVVFLAAFFIITSALAWMIIYSILTIGINVIWPSKRTGEWSNDALYPVTVTNSGVIDERWRITFTSTTEFSVYSVYGEHSGLVAVGKINICEPIFSVADEGWGTGWSIGNTISRDPEPA